MTGKLYLLKTFIITFICTVSCDYKCLCNYNVETEVFESPSDQGTAIGYLYEFDCKPVVTQSTGSDEWITIAFQHQVGYILKNDQTQIQACPGAAPSEDRLTTTEAQKTSISSTTMKPVTSTLSTKAPTAATKATPTMTETAATKIVTDSTTTHSTTKPTTASPTTTALPTTKTTLSKTNTQTTTSPKVTSTTSTASTKTVSSLSTASKVPTDTFGISTRTPATTSITTSSTVTSSSSATPSAKTTTERGQLTCPSAVQQRAAQEGGILFMNNHDRTCYELVPHRHSWSYAEQDCQSKGGHLATIKDYSDEYVVYTHVKPNNQVVWIGLHDRNHEEHFEWTSGEPVIYTNWHAGRKDPFFHRIEDCVAMGPLSGTWEDMDCQDRYQYICEFDAVYSGKNNLTSTAPTLIGSFTDGNTAICPSLVKLSARLDNGILSQHGQSCFELVSHSKVSWTHGENFCKNRGGHLAHISNAEEQGFIQAFMTRHMPQHAVWIGLHDLNVEGHFQWTSGNPVSYTNWVPGHMSNFASFKTEDCVAFIPYKNGQWDDIPCGGHSFFFGDSGETHPVLCQYDIRPSVIIG